MKFEFKITGTKLIIFLVIAIVPWIGMGAMYLFSDSDNTNLLIRNQRISYYDKEREVSGPWGNLKVIPITIQPPLSLVQDFSDLLNAGNEWKFQNTSLDNIRKLFRESGIAEDTVDLLIANTKALPGGKDFVTTPPDSTILNFTKGTRETLYPKIGKFKDNPTYTDPFIYPSNDPNEWLFASLLRKDLVKKIRPLIYLQNDICYISDLHIIMPYVKDQTERNILLQTMFRTRSLEIFLNIKNGQDISRIAEYWGTQKRIDHITPLLESIRNKKDGGTLDIVQLLPRIPRTRLNTFVTLDEYNKYDRNCHWITFNFFNEIPDERTKDISRLNRLVAQIATPLKPDQKPEIGDIILFVGQNDAVIHSCVYIAEDIVYTKDGLSKDRPFKFSYLNRVLSQY